MKDLTIVLLTYTPSHTHPRASYAEATIRSTLENAHYSGNLYVHVADDGSPDSHRVGLQRIAGGYPSVKGVSCSNSNRQGYGANYNLSTQMIHARGGYVLPLEDDWELTQPIDLDRIAAVLDEGISCVRLGYLGFTQELFGRIRSIAHQTVLELDPDSSEPHVWAGHPRLETVEFQRRVGPWPEGLDPGSTEFVVAQRQEARVGIVWPLDLFRVYAHIGTVQAREDQVPK